MHLESRVRQTVLEVLQSLRRDDIRDVAQRLVAIIVDALKLLVSLVGLQGGAQRVQHMRLLVHHGAPVHLAPG